MKIKPPKQVLSKKVLKLMAEMRERKRAIPVEWSCGHTAGAMCQQCWFELAQKSNELIAQNMHLRDALREALDAYERTGLVDRAHIERWRKALEWTP